MVAALACLAVLSVACGGGSGDEPPRTATATPEVPPTTSQPTEAAPTSASTVTPSPTDETPAPQPTTTPTPAEITDEDILGLVYWTEIDFWNRYLLFPEASQSTYDLLQAMSQNDTFLPYLIDLAAVPAPYSGFVYRLLAEKRPDHPYPIFPLTEELGARTPEDDTAVYVEFKHRLMKGIQEEMGAFLDPSKPRTLSRSGDLLGRRTRRRHPPAGAPELPDARGGRSLARAEGPRHRRRDQR